MLPQIWKEMVVRSASDPQCQPNVISYSALMTVYCQVMQCRQSGSYGALARSWVLASSPACLRASQLTPGDLSTACWHEGRQCGC